MMDSSHDTQEQQALSDLNQRIRTLRGSLLGLYAYSVDDALSLIPILPPESQQLKFHLEYLIFENVWVATIYGVGHKRYENHSTQPARAICEAWLQWQEGQDAP